MAGLAKGFAISTAKQFRIRNQSGDQSWHRGADFAMPLVGCRRRFQGDEEVVVAAAVAQQVIMWY